VLLWRWRFWSLADDIDHKTFEDTDALGMEADWPEGYFELLGSLSDEDLERPPELDPEDDLPREPL